MTVQLDRWRADTPGVAHRRHLNNAGSALPPRQVFEAVREHLQLEAEIGGYEAADLAAGRIERVYDAMARLLGCARHQVALVENATVAFAQALSAVPFVPGDVVLTSRADYTSNQIMFLSLTDRLGVEVVRVPDGPEGGLDLAALERLLDQRRPRLVALTHVPSHSGVVQPVAQVGRRCRERGVLYLVDACQSVGQMPVSPVEIGCDFLAGTGRKFLRGPRGTGFLYVSERALEEGLAPLLPDLHGAAWSAADAWTPVVGARRFENWEFSYALLLGLGAAAEYALEVGLDVIRHRARELARRTRERLAAIGGVSCLDRGPELSAICSFEISPRRWLGDGKSLQEELRRRRINTSIADASHVRLDLDERGIGWALRVSPHYYNTWDEIEALAEVLASFPPAAP